MMIDEPKLEESDTPVEENKETMWPESGLLLTFVEKASQKQKENTVTEIQATSTIEEPEGGTGSPTSLQKRMAKLMKNCKSYKLQMY